MGALETLRSLARFRLWPGNDENSNLDKVTHAFLSCDLPLLREEGNPGIRASAANLWGRLHPPYIMMLLLIGLRIQRKVRLPTAIWRDKILSFVFPCLGADVQRDSWGS